MEYWDLLDEKGRRTGKLHIRGEKVPEGFYYHVVEAVITDGAGKVLLMYRHPRKNHGDCWEIPGGASVAGEDSLTSIQREVSEETGLDIPKYDFSFIRTFRSRNSFHDFYHAVYPVAIEKIVCQEDETTDAMWADIKEFEEICKNGRFCKPIFERHYSEIIGILERETKA